MKAMKNTMKCLVAVFVMVMTFMVSGITAEATATVAAPQAPTGLGIYAHNSGIVYNSYGQEAYGKVKNSHLLSWNADSYLLTNYQYYGTSFGYLIEVKTLKNKKIKTFDVSASQLYISDDATKVIAPVKNKKLTKQGFKYTVTAYVIDPTTGQAVYGSKSAEKVIIPRATITYKDLTSKTSDDVKIKWNKVSGAKNYSVYVAKGSYAKFKKVGTTSSTSYVIKNCSDYTSYYVYVQANNVKYKKKKMKSTKQGATDNSAGTDSFYITRTYY